MPQLETNKSVNERQFQAGSRSQWRKINRYILKSVLYNLTVLAFLTTGQVSANHVMGNEISYRHIDSLKYEIVITYYRSCRSVALSDPSNLTSLLCESSGRTQKLTLTLRSIKDITPVCDSVSPQCNPSNTYNTGNGIEKHTYSALVDFGQSLYQPFYNCGKILIQTGQCCRSNTITTGAAYANYYNYAMMDFSKTDVNSSPVIRSFPNVYLCCYQAVRHYFGADDYADFDSLSYHLVPPLKGYNDSIAYSPPFTYTKPFTFYDPFKTGQSYPNASPPIGFYLDPVKGGIVFTPTKCDESTVVAYEVREWRKDTAGIYQHIGSVRRDIQYTTGNCPGNNVPVIADQLDYTVCEGDSVSFTINTYDVTFVPPPPLPTPAPDTVRLSWSGLFSDATMTLQDTNALHPTVRFSWRAKLNTGTNNIYSCTVTARDNACPRNNFTSRVITIRVLPAPSASLETAQHQCGTYSVNATNLANATNVAWQLFDTAGIPVTDTAIFHFGSTLNNYSRNLTDSLHIKRKGTWLLRLHVWEDYNCSRDFWDTLVDNRKYERLFSRTDTLVCDNQWIRLHPDLIDTADFKHFAWNTSAADTFSSIRINQHAGIATYSLKALTNEGCPLSGSVSVESRSAPSIKALANDTLCPPVNLIFKADSITDDGGLEANYIWENGDTNVLRTINSPGTYSLTATNFCGSDTMEFTLRQDLKPELAPIPDDSICLPGSIAIRPVDLHDSGLVKRSYLWNDGDTSSEKVINTGGLYEVVVSSMCGSDTSRFRIHATGTPDVNLGPDSTLRAPFSIKLVADTVEGSYLWGSGDTTRFVYARYYGKFWVTVTNRCGTSSDTIHFIRSASVGELTHGKINLIPNPNSGRFVLQSDGVDFNVLRLTDITGKEYAFTLDKSVNTAQYLTLVNATPGIYFLEIEQDGYLYVYRFAVW